MELLRNIATSKQGVKLSLLQRFRKDPPKIVIVLLRGVRVKENPRMMLRNGVGKGVRSLMLRIRITLKRIWRRIDIIVVNRKLIPLLMIAMRVVRWIGVLLIVPLMKVRARSSRGMRNRRKNFSLVNLRRVGGSLNRAVYCDE